MALILADGFDKYGTGTFSSSGIWAKPNYSFSQGTWGGLYGAPTIPVRYTGTIALCTEYGGYPSACTISHADLTTFVFGAALRCDAYGTFLIFRDSGTNQVYFRANSDYSIEVLRSGDEASLLKSDPLVYSPNRWHYLEIKVTISNNAGAVAVRFNGQVPPGMADVTGIDTQNAADSHVNQTVLYYAGGNCYWDDLYLLSGTGAPNDFLGDVRVTGLTPSGAGAHTDFGKVGAATNWQAAQTWDSDTSYVSAQSGTDTYAFSDLPSGLAGTVHGVVVTPFARKDDAGTRTLKPIVRPSSTDYEGTAVSMTGTYTGNSEIWTTNPDGGAWTIDAVNGSEFGVRTG